MLACKARISRDVRGQLAVRHATGLGNSAVLMKLLYHAAHCYPQLVEMKTSAMSAGRSFLRDNLTQQRLDEMAARLAQLGGTLKPA